jgi:hypothetical protein
MFILPRDRFGKLYGPETNRALLVGNSVALKACPTQEQDSKRPRLRRHSRASGRPPHPPRHKIPLASHRRLNQRQNPIVSPELKRVSRNAVKRFASRITCEWERRWHLAQSMREAIKGMVSSPPDLSSGCTFGAKLLPSFATDKPRREVVQVF